MPLGGRYGKCLDIWLKEFHWLQTRGTRGDLLMICKHFSRRTRSQLEDKLFRPTKNGRDPYLARYVGPRTQTEKS